MLIFFALTEVGVAIWVITSAGITLSQACGCPKPVDLIETVAFGTVLAITFFETATFGFSTRLLARKLPWLNEPPPTPSPT